MNAPFDHAMACRIHVCRRLWQRFGLAFGMGELRELERQIVSGDATWILDQTDRKRKSPRSVYRVTVKREDRKHTLFCVFDVRLWCLVTVLPSQEWIGRRKPCQTKLKFSKKH